VRIIRSLAATACVASIVACGTPPSGFPAQSGAEPDDGGAPAADATAGGAGDTGAAGEAGSFGDGGPVKDGGAPDAAGTPDGGCAAACTGGQVCVNGACVCPIYESFCGGQCIPTSSDPANCGACGTTCTGGTACSGGVCSSTCMAGLTACNGACVDLGSSDDDCGACGNKCPAGQGCVADASGKGSCQPSIVGGPPAGGCAGGGPPIVVTGGDAGAPSCTGAIAQTLFTWALCSCTDVTVSQTLLTDSYDSSKGPYQAPPYQLGGSVGLNGMMTVSAGASIYGTLWASSSSGTTVSSPTHVYQELHSGGSIGTSTSWAVSDDAYVNGNIGGNVAIGKTLYQPAADTRAAGVTYGTLVNQAVTVPQPCCGPQDQVPVAAIVAGAAGKNDDATAGFAPDVLVQGSTVERLDLPCGNYYFTEIAPQHALTIVAHGHTAIYVQGSVTASNPITITLDPGMTLDVFVAGSIDVSQVLTLGNPNYPALMRVYVGTTGALTFSQTANIAADFYAMYAHPVSWSQAAIVYGSVYVGDFIGSQVTAIHYDRAALTTGQECPPPATDAGIPGCQSCTDCGNQACVSGTCGSCTSSAQCCGPLQCQNGTCVLPAQ
jgi:hypothetical protein